MDDLERILFEAWDRITERARKDRVLALRRSQRRFKGVLTRPMRESCLVIRASDARIDLPHVIPEPFDAPKNHQPHTIEIDGHLVRHLTKPVMIPWPGVTYDEAAKLLGRSKGSLVEWVRQGVFQVDRYAAFKYPRHAKKRGLRHHKQRYTWDGRRIGVPLPEKGAEGWGRPRIWTPAPIDPNNFHGRAPHAIWGTLWQWMWERFPRDYALEVQRVPRIRHQQTRRGVKPRFVGWEFICPGRLDDDMEYKGCGARCTYLYAPMTVWTMGMFAQGLIDIGLDMAEDSGLKGQWFPGLSDTIGGGGPRSFACKKCWGVRSACMANDIGWNEFITHISGGLLFGRDVPRPLEICPIKRKKPPYTRPRRRAAHEQGEAPRLAEAS